AEVRLPVLGVVRRLDWRRSVASRSSPCMARTSGSTRPAFSVPAILPALCDPEQGVICPVSRTKGGQLAHPEPMAVACWGGRADCPRPIRRRAWMYDKIVILGAAGRPPQWPGPTDSGARAPRSTGPQAPWHFLYFLPDPHQHGSLRPILVLRDPDAVSLAPTAAPAPAITLVPTAPDEVLVTAAPAPFEPSPVTSGRLSVMRRTGCAGGWTTVTRKIVW